LLSVAAPVVSDDTLVVKAPAESAVFQGLSLAEVTATIDVSLNRFQKYFIALSQK
jgi:hypothetical protein